MSSKLGLCITKCYIPTLQQIINTASSFLLIQTYAQQFLFYEGWNFNSDNYLFTTDTK